METYLKGYMSKEGRTASQREEMQDFLERRAKDPNATQEQRERYERQLQSFQGRDPYQAPGYLSSAWEAVRTSPYSVLNTRTGYLRHVSPIAALDPGSDQFIPTKIWRNADNYVAGPITEILSRRGGEVVENISESAQQEIPKLVSTAADAAEREVQQRVDRVTGGLGDVLKPFMNFFTDSEGNINWQNLAWLLPALGLGGYGLFGQGGGLGRGLGGLALGAGGGLIGRDLWGRYGSDWMDHFQRGRDQSK